VVFHASTAGLRAFGLETSGQWEAATREAWRSLAIHRHNYNARLVLGAEGLRLGRLDEAQSQIDSLLTDDPAQPTGLKLREQIAAARQAAAGH